MNIMGRFCRWLRERETPKPEPIMAVPKEVRDASHDLNNAVMRARFHIAKAEAELHPIEDLIAAMRKNDAGT